MLQQSYDGVWPANSSVQQSWGPEEAGGCSTSRPSFLSPAWLPLLPPKSQASEEGSVVWFRGQRNGWAWGCEVGTNLVLIYQPLQLGSACSLSAHHGTLLHAQCWFTYLTLRPVQDGCQNLVIWNSKMPANHKEQTAALLKHPLFWWPRPLPISLLPSMFSLAVMCTLIVLA